MSQLHSSVMPDETLTEYISDECKYYYLPLFGKTLFPERIEEILGAGNKVDRSPSEVRDSIIKAKRAQYSHFKIPYDRIDDAFVDWVLRRFEDSGKGVVLQICASFLYDENFYNSVKSLDSSFEIEWVLDDTKGLIVDRLLLLKKQFKSHVSICVHKDLSWSDSIVTKIMREFKNIHLYFPYQLSLSEPFLNCKESHKVVGMLRKKYTAHNFLPPKGVDLWDHRARSDFDMEPFVFPCLQTQSANPKIKYSVIIPTYNNQNHLRVVLKHLYKQNVGLDSFEVIVVDDGGTDQTQTLVFDLLESFPHAMNFKYIFFQRHRKRVMGDSQYRAGISRNLGVKNASGEILSFLDSDIIVPTNYLEKVDKALETYDAIQAKRINLSQSASSLSFEYDKVSENRDLIPDEPYWEEFVATTKEWDKLPYNWKYVCTHSFSMRKDLFWKVGGLKKNFIFYGFEDTDLGYRLVKRGYKLHLLDVRVFHMFHENTRSEFMNLKSLRHNLLSRTAQIFYLHHLDEDIFENLLGFMEPEPTFQRFVNRIAKTASFKFIWGKRPEVYKSMNRRQGSPS